jgi:signal transduction histidine kinase
MTENGSETGYLRTLLQLGQTLNVSLDLSQVLHIVIEQVVQFVRAERGFILLVEEKTGRVWGKATHGIDPTAIEAALNGHDPGNRPEISRTIVEQALRERCVVLSTNAMEDPRFASRTSVRLAHVRSVLCVPLIAQGRLLGIIYLDNRIRTGVFSDHDAEMLEAFANQAAVAVENARLYDNLRRSLEERLRLQQELHENETRRRALEEANRLKSDFIGFLSHELRNPLTTIRGYAQTLSVGDGSLEPVVRKEFLETIEAECDRVLNLINELLDSARLEANRPLALNTRPLDIASLLQKQAQAQQFYNYWTQAHCMVVDIAPDLPEVLADEDKVNQIMANLLSNAIKYSPEGGPITMTARPANGGVEIMVRDEGVGMSDEQQSLLFGKYERLEREEIRNISGAGLGLYLTRRLVELHGGTISCRSVPGQGSAFTVFLPARPPSA